MKNLSLCYSPCPNDTFIFYAIVHGVIETSRILFNEILLDVETAGIIPKAEEPLFL